MCLIVFRKAQKYIQSLTWYQACIVYKNPASKLKTRFFPGSNQIRSIRSVFGWNWTGTEKSDRIDRNRISGRTLCTVQWQTKEYTHFRAHASAREESLQYIYIVNFRAHASAREESPIYILYIYISEHTRPQGRNLSRSQQAWTLWILTR